MWISKLLKKIILSFLVVAITTINMTWISSAVKVQIPEWDRQSDVMVTPQESQIDSSTGEKDIFELIQIINKYLWFSIGAIALVWLIIWWFRLLTSEGDEEANKKTSKMLLWSAIWIGIAMLSYAIVRLIVNLL